MAGLLCGGCSGEDNPNAESNDAIGGGGINLSETDSETDDTDGDADDDTGPILDVGDGEGPNASGGDCPGNGGGSAADDYSLIWIANSPEGTVSKIDTRTGQELARYYSGPSQGQDDPSRTSVNLSGDVAVTNRAGGIAKIASVPENCVDANGDGTIQTSTGPGDVLAWGTDECVLWYQALPSDGDNNHGPRPTAWDGGAGQLGSNCNGPAESLWVGWWDAPANSGEFRRLDGSTGIIEDVVSVPDWNGTGTNYGPYGGAVDGDGNLWAIGLWENLVRIDAETLDVERWVFPDGADPYGIAIDAEGRPWTAGWEGLITRFDPGTGQFDTVATSDGRRMRGLQIDRDGVVWIAANSPCGAISVDASSMSILNGNIALPGCIDPVGVSIDVDGSVWLPDREANVAFKLDPVTLTSTITSGLLGPYTYSDMTGAGLGLVTNPPAG